MNDDFFWSADCQAIKAGETGYLLEGSPYCIFDSGSSHIMVPPDLWEPFMDAVFSATGFLAKYVVERGTVYVDCTQKDLFEPVSFMIKQHYITMFPKDYIYDVNGDNSVCVLLFAKNTYNFFILGTPIYQGYYAIHNMEDSTLTYAPLSLSGKPVPELSPFPTQFLLDNSLSKDFVSRYANMLYWTAVLFLSFGLAWLLNKWIDASVDANAWKYIVIFSIYFAGMGYLYFFVVRVWLSSYGTQNIDQETHAEVEPTTLVASFALLGGGLYLFANSKSEQKTPSLSAEETHSVSLSNLME